MKHCTIHVQKFLRNTAIITGIDKPIYAAVTGDQAAITGIYREDTQL